MKVVWTQRARRQLHTIQKYIQRRSPKGAHRVWVRIVERVAKQAETPHAAPIERDGPARVLVITDTPYIITYHVVGDEMRVLTVMHTAQRQ